MYAYLFPSVALSKSFNLFLLFLLIWKLLPAYLFHSIL